MSRLPGHLLVHGVTVEPYRSWGVYDSPRRMRCVISEQMSAWRGQPGVEQISTITVHAQLDEDCPAGSMVTMPDGRRGYAVAVLRYDGGGLPTPDHMEIAVNINAPVYSPAWGETVVIKRAIRTSPDRYGNVRFSYTDVHIPGCAVRLMSSSENVTHSADQVVTNIEVTMPPETEVNAKDKLVVRGLLYEINGQPTPVEDAMTGGRTGVKVVGLRYGA